MKKTTETTDRKMDPPKICEFTIFKFKFSNDPISGEQRKKERKRLRKAYVIMEYHSKKLCVNYCSSKGGERGKKDIKLQEVMGENSQTWGNSWTSKFLKLTCHQTNSKRDSPKHIIIKVSKIKSKERILKAAREKKLVTYR